MPVTSMPASHVAIIIVNYKGQVDTLECLASLEKLTYPVFSVLLVDQASEDGTPEAVRSRFPTVTVIESAENDGFSGGNNRAIRRAIEQGADHVFLLNNDTIVAPDLLERLVAAAESDERIGIVGPLMLYYDAPDTVWSAGGAMNARGDSRMRDQGARVDSIPGALYDVDFVVGCGLMGKRALWEQVGLLDDRFFLYYEEADLCARARQAGWRIVTDARARLWHKVSRSTGTDSDATLYYMRRNQLQYLEKNAAHSVRARGRAVIDAARLILVWTLRGERRRAGVVWAAVGDYLRRRMGKTERRFTL